MARAVVLLLVVALLLVGLGYRNALAEPMVRRVTIGLPDWPERAPSVTVALLSDLHVAGPDMPPDRLSRIVGQVNRLRPDLVLLAGDFVSDKRVATHRYGVAEAVEPLADLRSSLGTLAVLGNHDHWRDAAAFRSALPGIGVSLLDNSAVRAGPLVVAGTDDDFTGHADLAAVSTAIAALAGPVVVLSHSPDVAPRLPRRATLVLAGHTHCGQISLPLVGPISTFSRYGKRYACGIVREPGRVTIIGAGLGTSLLPIRFGAPPDIWLVTLRPASP